MFSNVNQSLFTFSTAGGRVVNKQPVQGNTCKVTRSTTMTIRPQAGPSFSSVKPSHVKMSMAADSSISASSSKQSFGFSASYKNADFSKMSSGKSNQYTRFEGAPSMSAASNGIGVRKGAAAQSGSTFLNQRQAGFMSGYRMVNNVSKPAARAGPGPVMSTGFNVSGSKQNQIIDNYQDMSMGAVRRTQRRAGWGRMAQPRSSALRATTIMMAGEVPEGSWADVKRQPVVGGNWKSNGDMDFVNSFPKNVLNESTFDASKMSVCVAPTDIHLAAVQAEVKDGINVMAQDVSQYPKGAYTGNVTADQLKDIGVKWTLTGHSERRTLCNESDKDVALKTKAAIEEGVTVMACIGEQLEDRESGKTDEVNARQLKAIADEITESQWGDVVIAYEPVWAIGTGKVATPEQAEETQANIRKWLAENVSDDVAGKTRILYGGSVNAGNCADLMKKPNIDGFLVGGASLKDDFKTIIETVAESV